MKSTATSPLGAFPCTVVCVELNFSGVVSMKKQFWMTLFANWGYFCWRLQRPGCRPKPFEVGAQLAIHDLPELGETRGRLRFQVHRQFYTAVFGVDSEINFFPRVPPEISVRRSLLRLASGSTRQPLGCLREAAPGLHEFWGRGFPAATLVANSFRLGHRRSARVRRASTHCLALGSRRRAHRLWRRVPERARGLVAHLLARQHNFESTIGAVLRF